MIIEVPIPIWAIFCQYGSWQIAVRACISGILLIRIAAFPVDVPDGPQLIPLPVVPLGQIQLFRSAEHVAASSQVAHKSSSQVIPLPSKPALHAQVKLPSVSVHVAWALQTLVSRHSFLFVHAVPLPSQPRLQEHVKPPSLLVQLALTSQLSDPFAHSLISVQTVPVPVNPDRQVQEKPPSRF